MKCEENYKVKIKVLNHKSSVFNHLESQSGLYAMRDLLNSEKSKRFDGRSTSSVNATRFRDQLFNCKSNNILIIDHLDIY